MRTKRTIAALLALLLMLSALAGCGGQPSSSAPESSQPSSSSKAVSQEASSEDASQPEEDGETYTVSVMTIGDAKTEDCNEVAAYISSITKDLAGVEVQLTRGGEWRADESGAGLWGEDGHCGSVPLGYLHDHAGGQRADSAH